MQGIKIRMKKNIKTITYTKYAFLAVGLSFLIGCAALDYKKAKPSVTRLDGDVEGFIIREVSQIDDASRKDFNSGVTMLKDKDYEQAIELFQKVIEKSPGVTAPYINIAIAYQGIDKPERAEEYLKTALNVFPDHPAVCNEYGLLYRKTGRFVDAKAIYEKAIAHFPEYYPVHRNLGILCDLYLNDPVCALKHYEVYSKAKPEDKQVKIWIAGLRLAIKSN